MAQKDWEKSYNSPGFQYENRKINQTLIVYKNGTWWFNVTNYDTYEQLSKPKQFKTRSQAISYAKKYMRSH